MRAEMLALLRTVCAIYLEGGSKPVQLGKVLSRTGCNRETFNRLLGELNAQGMLKMSANRKARGIIPTTRGIALACTNMPVPPPPLTYACRRDRRIIGLFRAGNTCEQIALLTKSTPEIVANALSKIPQSDAYTRRIISVKHLQRLAGITPE